MWAKPVGCPPTKTLERHYPWGVPHPTPYTEGGVALVYIHIVVRSAVAVTVTVQAKITICSAINNKLCQTLKGHVFTDHVFKDHVPKESVFKDHALREHVVNYPRTMCSRTMCSRTRTMCSNTMCYTFLRIMCPRFSDD